MLENRNEKFIVKKTTGCTVDGKEKISYQILNNKIPMFTVNKFLEFIGSNSENTGYQYANRLCSFFKFLNDKRNKNYMEATKQDVSKFVDSLLFESDGFFRVDKGRLSYNTVSAYLTVVKRFYLYLEDTLDEEINIDFKKVKRSAKHTYLYGQIWDLDFKELLNGRASKMKSVTEYEKWYTEEQKEAIKDNLNTLRDKAIFELSLEGMRIDEILSLRMNDFDSSNRQVYPYRSKGKETGNVGSSVTLRMETAKLLDDYMFNERDIALIKKEEMDENFIYPDEIFINLKVGEYLAQPLKYRNFIEILKKAGDRAGIGYEKIRTHSGRSTKTMELLYYQSTHPEENITDEQIRQMMRWSSPQSIKSYINYSDIRTGRLTAEKISKAKSKSTL